MGDGRGADRARGALAVASAVLTVVSTQVTWWDFGPLDFGPESSEQGVLIALAVLAGVAALLAAETMATTATALLAGGLLMTIVAVAGGDDDPGTGLWLAGAALACAGIALLLSLAGARRLRRTVVALIVLVPVALAAAAVVATPSTHELEVTVIR